MGLDFPDLESSDLKRIVERSAEKYNRSGIADFEGYSPEEMRRVMYEPFSVDSAVQFSTMSESDYGRVPFFNLTKYFLKIVKDQGEVKLTQAGYLPPKIVKEMYAQGFILDKMIEWEVTKLTKEMDCPVINLMRELAQISGLIKKRNGKLSMTKKGAGVIDNDPQLFNVIFRDFCTKFSWAYCDGFKSKSIGQYSFAFSLILINRYGGKKRPVSFYAEKYYKAWPHLRIPVTEWGFDISDHCYWMRTFERFMVYFGLVEMEETDYPPDDPYVKRTDLFDKLVVCIPPKK